MMMRVEVPENLVVGEARSEVHESKKVAQCDAVPANCSPRIGSAGIPDRVAGRTVHPVACPASCQPCAPPTTLALAKTHSCSPEVGQLTVINFAHAHAVSPQGSAQLPLLAQQLDTAPKLARCIFVGFQMSKAHNGQSLVHILRKCAVRRPWRVWLGRIPTVSQFHSFAGLFHSLPHYKTGLGPG